MDFVVRVDAKQRLVRRQPIADVHFRRIAVSRDGARRAVGLDDRHDELVDPHEPWQWIFPIAVCVILATLAVLAGWPVVGKVSELRGAGPEARAAFVTWHLVSLLLNMLAIGLVGVALVLAAALPERKNDPQIPQMTKIR